MCSGTSAGIEGTSDQTIHSVIPSITDFLMLSSVSLFKVHFILAWFTQGSVQTKSLSRALLQRKEDPGIWSSLVTHINCSPALLLQTLL